MWIAHSNEMVSAKIESHLLVSRRNVFCELFLKERKNDCYIRNTSTSVCALTTGDLKLVPD